jgi:hypothetical protein
VLQLVVDRPANDSFADHWIELGIQPDCPQAAGLGQDLARGAQRNSPTKPEYFARLGDV